MASGPTTSAPILEWRLEPKIDAQIAPGVKPVVFEPVVGLIPLGSLLSGQIRYNGNDVCSTVIFLHVGGDQYIG